MMEDVNGAGLLHIMSLAIPLSAVHSCINGYYYGLKKAGIPAFSQLFEQFVRVSGVWLMMQVAAKLGQTPTPALAVWGLVIGGSGSHPVLSDRHADLSAGQADSQTPCRNPVPAGASSSGRIL